MALTIRPTATLSNEGGSSAHAVSPKNETAKSDGNAFSVRSNVESSGVYKPSQTPKPESTATHTHVVKPNETLSGIAKDNGKTVDQVRAQNPQIKDPNKIYPGQRIKIDDHAQSHIVSKGDTLWEIARANKVSVAQLKATNESQLKNKGDLILPGQKLIIPDKGGVYPSREKITGASIAPASKAAPNQPPVTAKPVAPKTTPTLSNAHQPSSTAPKITPTPTNNKPNVQTPLAKAQQSHLNQLAGDPSRSNNNCGFASVNMALSYLGVDAYKVKQYPANATPAQKNATDQQNYQATMNLRKIGGGGTSDSGYGLVPQVRAAADIGGGKDVTATILAKNPSLSGGQNHDNYLKAMQNTFAKSDNSVFVLAGNPATGWGADKSFSGKYATRDGNPYNGGHFVAAVDYNSATNKFTVLDPIAKQPIEVSPAQLKKYLSDDHAVNQEIVQITKK